MEENGLNRRDFLTLASAAGAVAATAGCASVTGAAGSSERPLFGVCIGGALNNVPDMKAAGFDYFEGSVSPTLIPSQDDEAWKRQKETLLSQALPVRACNGFLPGTFRLTGEIKDLTWEAALKYAETACRRADEVGIRAIVFGSGGARNVPFAFRPGGGREFAKGYGVQEGRDQFVAFNKLLAKRIEGCRVQVVIEPLCPNESNIFNYVWQGVQLVNEVKSERIRVLADFFHMHAGMEPVTSIDDAGDLLKHCHVAMPKTRLAPGLSDPGVVPEYFKALKRIGYRGGVSIESGWKAEDTAVSMHDKRVKAVELLHGWWANA